MEDKDVEESRILNKISLFLIFLTFCGFYGHSLNIYVHRIPAIVLFIISILRIFVCIKHKNIKKYKYSFKYFTWYIIFIIYNLFSIIWSIDVEYSVDLMIGILITIFYIFGIMIYATDYEKLKNVMKILIFAYVYMSIRLLLFETAQPGTENYGNVVGLYFNRIALSLAYGILISFYLYKKEKKYIYLIFILLFYYIIYLTGSRKGLLMPIAFIGLFLLLNMGISLKKLLKNFIIIIGIIIVLISIIKSNDTLEKRIMDLYDSIVNDSTTEDGSIIERRYFRETAMEIFYENPLIGIGTNGFRAFLRLIGYNGTISYSHCNYTELLATLGIIGFGLYYVMYVKILRKVFENYNSSNIDKILSISFIVVQTIFEYGFVSFYLFEFQVLVAIIYLNTQYSNIKMRRN